MTSARTIIALLIPKLRRAAPCAAQRLLSPNQLKNPRRPWPIVILIAAVALAAGAGTARASCNDDCKSEYVSAMGECRTQYEKGESDLQDLEDCLVDTQGEYDDCIDDCTSLGAGGVVACASPGSSVMPVKFVVRAPAPSD
jgi:hypothetical protein